MREKISCTEADLLRVGLRPLSSITNYVGGEVLDPRLPACTATTWGLADGTEVIDEVLDAEGCRHYRARDVEPRRVDPPTDIR